MTSLLLFRRLPPLLLLCLAIDAVSAANMAPIAVTGFNRDLVVESGSSGPAYTTATELNPGEGTAFYQSGLSGKSYGLPAGGSFTSALDSATVFQFQSYTASNALVLNTSTGLTTGTLSLATPQLYNRIAILAHSASATATSAGTLTLTFKDGTTFITNYSAPDWFNNSGYALSGMERINLSAGTTQGNPGNPRFYQTSIDLKTLFGSTNKALSSLTFARASSASSTAIYAISGELAAQVPASIAAQPSSLTVAEFGSATFTATAAGNPAPALQWLRNGISIPGATNSAYTLSPVSLTNNGALYSLMASNLVSNIVCTATSSVATLTVTPINKPIGAMGYNRDVVVESNASGPPYTAYALEMNPAEGNAFYQSGLAGTSYGLPASGSFFSAADGTLFQFQPYTNNNALVLSSETGLTSGTLTLTNPQTYQSIALIAHSGNGDSSGTASLTLHFTDGTDYATTYAAPDWFGNTANVALQGTERISLSSGTTQGATTNPRFYQTTLNLASLLGVTNKPLSSLTLDMASTATATAIYALSGVVAPPSPPIFVAQPTNLTVMELAPASLAPAVSGNPYPTLQWYQNGAAIPGATNMVYSIPAVALSNSGLGLTLVAANYYSNALHSVTSSVAVLTVTPDTAPPVLLSAATLSLTQVQVQYSERVTPSTATNLANYILTGTNGSLAVLSAVMDATQSNVVLTTTAMLERAPYTLTVSHVTDQSVAANVIAANSQAAFLASSYASIAIGAPALAGGQTVLSDGVQVSGGGTGISGTNDQGQFSCQTTTGNFDVAVRIASLGLTVDWAQAALMARESLAAGGRFAASVATPSMNGCYYAWRDPAGGSNATSGSFPANYPNTWLRLKRAGNVFSGYAGYDGQTWTMLGSQTIALSNQLYLGFAVSGNSTNQTATARFVGPVNVTNGVVAAFSQPHEPIGPSSRRTGIVISEIMWKPAPRTDAYNLEFVELYNSTPWFQDLSGYQLTCADMSYTFPAGTLISGGAYLVVAASPTGIQNVYGITNIVGPYTGSLKKAETLQLLDEQGSVLLTVPYTGASPWPVATDGTGHSLILANPSYGEGDPRAWDISDIAGGSPGVMECYRPSPLRSVVINEVLSHTETAGIPQFVELYNHSTNAVDLSGCVLTDDPASNKFVLPQGTTLGAAGFASFTQSQLGFALSATGGTLYFLKPDGSRVLDAAQFTAQSNGVAYGRWPDGANDFYSLEARTPGTNNSTILVGDIVINELMYNPISGDDDAQYLELYNKGASTVSLAGWQLVSGVSFTFPSGTSLAAGGYLVVARNLTNLLALYPNLTAANTVGNFSGKLSHKGERVALTMPVSYYGTNTLYAVEDEVTYVSGGRWGQWAAGGGSSLELIDPNSNHRLAANWADSDETTKSVWTNLSFTGVLDLGGNYSGSAIDCVQLGLLDAGECLVDNVELRNGATGANTIANPDFETGTLTNWDPQGSCIRTSLESTGYASAHSLHLRCSSHVWTGANSVQGYLNATNLASGSNATLRLAARWLRGWPEILMRVRGNWIELTGALPVPKNLGSPGQGNSRSVAHAGPAIYNVKHTPALPAAGQAVVVTAQFHDRSPASATLLYRVDTAVNANPAYTSVAMTDSGTGADAVAADGVYSATIPAQAAGTVVAFLVKATDSTGSNSVFPAVLNDNSGLPRECVVAFGDTLPAGSFGHYHHWITRNWINRWSSLPPLSNEDHDGTWVDGGGRIIYNMGARFSGSPYHQGYDSPVGNLCNFRATMPDDDAFLGATSFNKVHVPGNGPGDDLTLQCEQTSYWMARQIGLPWNYRRYVAVFVNGNRRGSLMEDSQVPGSDVVKQLWPNDDNGVLCKNNQWFEFDSAGRSPGVQDGCTLNSYTTTGGAKKPGRYRWTYELKSTPDSYNNFTDVYALIDAANTPTNDPAYQANIEALVDTEEWMRMSAIEHATGDLDSIFTAVEWNMYSYKPTQGKWTVLKWDWNITLGNSYSWGPNGNNLFTLPSSDTPRRTMLSFPPWQRAYLRALNDIAAGPMNNANVNPMLEAKYAALTANGIAVSSPAALESWIGTMHNSLLSALASQSATSQAFAITGTNYVATNSDYITLTGTAPVQVKTILINGVAYPFTWLSPLTWSVTVPLKQSTNTLSFQGYDLHSNLLASASAAITINNTGAAPTPLGNVVINEVLWNPAVSGGQFVELYNRSTSQAYDLSGWELQGLGYTFPSGSLMLPNSFLVLAADAVGFVEAYGATNTIFDTFSGTLQPGQLLKLIQPGTGGSSNTVIAQLLFDSSAPWPTTVAGKSLQLVDPAQDAWRPGNWGSGTPTPDATNSINASLAAFPPLWLNEIEPGNLTGLTNRAGQRVPWLELFNPSATNVPLGGLFLANNYTNLLQWAFPSNAAIGARQFLVVFADSLTNLSTTNELHASFTLPATAGSLALTRLTTNSQLQVLDYLNYSNLAPDYAYGSFPDGQSFIRQLFFSPSPGASNNGSAVPPPSFIPYLTAGSVYSQDFNSLPNPGASSVNTANPVTINGITYSLANPFDLAYPVSSSGNNGGLGLSALAGWYGMADPSASVGTRFGATSGDQTTGGQLSFGLPGSANRALGLLATSTTGYTLFGAKLINGTGQTLHFINLSVTGEVWRQSNLKKTLQFFYRIDPASTNPLSASATAFLPALDVNIPVQPAAVGGVAVDGTAAINQTNLSVSNQVITNWTPGSALWLVWEMVSPTGKAQGLAIDNLTFSASAWPSGMSQPSLAARPVGTNLVMSCPTWPGLNYQLQSRTNLVLGAWLPTAPAVPGTGSPFFFTNSIGSAPQMFYRIVIQP
jgi:hypothetical protein